jgi:hypothetical protein
MVEIGQYVEAAMGAAPEQPGERGTGRRAAAFSQGDWSPEVAEQVAPLKFGHFPMATPDRLRGNALTPCPEGTLEK